MTRRNLLLRAREQLRSGAYVPRRARAAASRALIVATDHDPAELSALVDELMDLQLHHPHIKPILLVGATSDTHVLRSSGFLYESLLADDDLASLGLPGTWEDYRRGRLATAVDVYDPHVVVELAPSERPTAKQLLGHHDLPD